MLSTELDEHVELMDRVLVFREHELFKEFDRSEVTRERPRRRVLRDEEAMSDAARPTPARGRAASRRGRSLKARLADVARHNSYAFSALLLAAAADRDADPGRTATSASPTSSRSRRR